MNSTFTKHSFIPFLEKIVIDFLASIDEDDFEFDLKCFEMIHHPIFKK